MAKINNQDLKHLVDSVGSFIKYWGFKDIEGKVWTTLMLSPTPLSSNDLQERLGVSKALMSLSLNTLLEYDVIIPYTRVAKGKTFYVINQDITSVIRKVLLRREAKLLENVLESAQKLKSSSAGLALIDPKRLNYIIQMAKKGKNILHSVTTKDKSLISFFFGKATKTRELI